MKNKLSIFLVFTTIILVAYAQHGPIPQRLQIPGAISLGGFPSESPQQYRNERVAPVAQGLVRVRRPQHIVKSQPLPIPQQQRLSLDEAKPVNEEYEEEQPSFLPILQQHPIPQQQQQQQHHQNNLPISQEQHLTETVRAIEREFQQHAVAPGAPQNHHHQPSGVTRFNFGPERSAPSSPPPPPPPSQPQPSPQPKPIARRPSYREPAPQQYSEPEPVHHQQQQQQPAGRRIHQDNVPSTRPRNSQEHHQHQEREQKPVAQILRKYREENEDGSITWGFENDDGSYKEEFIGIDCITRGRYGYIDPDGMKREYTYETGNACDPNKRDKNDDDEDDEIKDGYIDYQNQEMVLANGDRFNIGNLGGKNKVRKPSGQQQQQQQSSYRN